jgi:hypothetical protein
VIHFGTGASGFFRELHAAGGDVMGVDWRINIDQAWMDISYRSAIQGNLDPVALFAPLPELRAKVHELLKRTGTRPGHIFNLGHGILPETPVENVKAWWRWSGNSGREAGASCCSPTERRNAWRTHRGRADAIGGSSPLLAWTRVQAEALERDARHPVFFGMRNWHPFIRETMDRVRDAGLERIAAIAMAPQFSELSVGLYIRRTEEARREAGVAAEIVWARSFHDEPLLIEAFAEKLAPVAAGRKVLFTAHSLPEKALGRRSLRPRNARHGRGGGGAARAGRLGVRLPEPGPYRRPLAGAHRGILPGPLCRRGHPRSGG